MSGYTAIPVYDLSPWAQYTGTGETALVYPFLVFDAGDLQVWKWDGTTETLLTEGTDYSVTGLENPSGGTVELVAPATDGAIYTLERAMPYERTSDYTEAGDFFALNINRDLDRIILMIQQLRQLQRRSVLTARTAGQTEVQFPATEPGKVLGWDDSGDAILTNYSLPDQATLEALRKALNEEAFPDGLSLSGSPDASGTVTLLDLESVVSGDPATVRGQIDLAARSGSDWLAATLFLSAHRNAGTWSGPAPTIQRDSEGSGWDLSASIAGGVALISLTAPGAADWTASARLVTV